MPFVSEKQNAWAHTEAGKKALGGAAKVKEWEHATDYSKLPERAHKPSYKQARAARKSNG